MVKYVVVWQWDVMKKGREWKKRIVVPEIQFDVLRSLSIREEKKEMFRG